MTIYEGNQVRRTLEVVCVLCVVFMLYFIFDHGIVSYALFFSYHTFFHASLAVRSAEN